MAFKHKRIIEMENKMQAGRSNNKKYAIGVDVGGTKILLILADRQGNVAFKKKVDSSGDLEDVCSIIDGFLQESQIQSEEIAGMCLGVPGEINGEGVVRLSIQLGWKNINVKDYVSRRYPFPVYVKNDVNLSALGEKWLGNGENTDHLVYISIGTGIGGAIIANGHLVEGFGYSAGEIGYFTDREDVIKDRMNSLSNFGNLERKISGKSITEKAQCIGMSAPELFSQYSKGNREVDEIINQFVLELSIVIANTLCFLNPEYVIIGGGVSESLGAIMPSIQQMVSQISIFQSKIRLSKLGGETGAFGCIYYVFFEALGKNIQ